MPDVDRSAKPTMGIRCPKCRKGSLVRSTKQDGPYLGWVECQNSECAYKDTIQNVVAEHRKRIGGLALGHRKGKRIVRTA
jgi:hypothetical protein